jgi:hypothetical protein
LNSKKADLAARLFHVLGCADLNGPATTSRAFSAYHQPLVPRLLAQALVRAQVLVLPQALALQSDQTSPLAQLALRAPGLPRPGLLARAF